MADDLTIGALQPGTTMRHRDGGTVTLKELKADGSGWWNTDGSGLCWAALKGDDWAVEPVVHMAGCDDDRPEWRDA